MKRTTRQHQLPNLLLCDLEVGHDIVHQFREVWDEDLTQFCVLDEGADKLKDGEHSTLIGDDVTITVARFRQALCPIHHRTYIAARHKLRKC